MKYFFKIKNIKKNKFIAVYVSKLFVIVLFSLVIGMGYLEHNNLRYLGVFNVISDSMSPTIKKGSILITEASEVYQTSDVITFLDPRNGYSKITHRINNVKIVNDEVVYKTKGDGNEDIDPWDVASGSVVGRVVFVIPFVGFFVSAIRSPFGLLFLIILPLGVLFFMELEMLINNINRIFKRNRKEKVSLPYGV